MFSKLWKRIRKFFHDAKNYLKKNLNKILAPLVAGAVMIPLQIGGVAAIDSLFLGLLTTVPGLMILVFMYFICFYVSYMIGFYLFEKIWAMDFSSESDLIEEIEAEPNTVTV